MNKVEYSKYYVMKKILILLILAGMLTSCYDEFRVDYDHTTVAFSNATGGAEDGDVLHRTIVKDEGLDLDFGVYLAGVLDNNKERWAEFEIDPSLVSGTSYELMPEDYYTLSDDSRITIPAGENIGRINIKLDSASFVDDPNATSLHYAIPFRLTSTSEDSILETQSTKLVVIQYINHYDGYYVQTGSFATFDENGDQINSGEIDNVIDASTVMKDTVLTNGMIKKGADHRLKMHPNSDQSVYLEYKPNPIPPQIENIAPKGSPSTDYVSGWETLEAINDGQDAANSNTRPDGGIYGNWYSGGMWRYVQYEWENAYKVDRGAVYWFTDGGGLLIPDSSYYEYWNLETEEWQRVPNPDQGITEGNLADQYNETNWDPVVTNKVRLNFKHSVESCGIIEWKVWGILAPTTPEQAEIAQVAPTGDNTYDESTNKFTLDYRIDYENGGYSTVTSEMVWRNRVRDGVNEWRDH